MEIAVLPKSLSEITLAKYIAWNEQYGDALKKRADKLKTEDDKLLFNTDFYAQHYAHYSDTDYAEVQEALGNGTDFYVEMLKEASASVMMLSREMGDIQYVDVVNCVYEYAGIVWHIKPPVEVVNEADITVDEFDRIQGIALIFSDLQDGNTSALIDLVKAYLQPVSPLHLVPEGTALQENMPLNIALCVRKYVQDTIVLYSQLNKNDTGAVTS